MKRMVLLRSLKLAGHKSENSYIGFHNNYVGRSGILKNAEKNLDIPI
jgi:hypothetical protein